MKMRDSKPVQLMNMGETINQFQEMKIGNIGEKTILADLDERQ
jgi:hypothetical protein